MSCDPPRIGRTPPPVFVFNVEYHAKRRRNENCIAPVCMNDTLWLPSSSGGVKNVERIFGIHDFRVTFCGGNWQCHDIPVPEISARFHVYLFPGPPNSDADFDRGRSLHGLISNGLQLCCFSSPESS